MFDQPGFPWNKGISLSYLNPQIPKVVVRCFALGRLEIPFPRLSCGQWCLCLQDLGHGDQSTGDVFNDAISISRSLKNGGVIAHICSLENDWLFIMSRDPHLWCFELCLIFNGKLFGIFLQVREQPDASLLVSVVPWQHQQKHGEIQLIGSMGRTVYLPTFPIQINH